jgi:nucleoside-diphosphate kinase
MKSLFISLMLICAHSMLFADDQPVKMECTLTIVKPDAVAVNKTGEIIARFEQGNLKIVGLKMTQLSKESAEEFYSVHKDKPFYPDLVKFMSRGPIVVMALEGPNAVAKAREIIGATDPKKAAPKTIRADFATSVTENAVHGSDSLANARNEIAFFFMPDEIFKR